MMRPMPPVAEPAPARARARMSDPSAPAAVPGEAAAEAVAASPRQRRWPPPALAVRPYRWYWASQWPVFLGTWMQVVALGYYVYTTTGSQTAVGIVAAADRIPAVLLSLF